MPITTEIARQNGLKGGRPVSKATIIAQKTREYLAVALERRLKPIVEAQLDAAMGIETEAFDRRTGKLYYKDPGPNVVAFKTILEQVVGRPKETVEMSGPEGNPVPVEIVHSIKKIYGSFPEGV